MTHMTSLRPRQLSPSITAYGDGSIGGKGEGLLLLDNVHAKNRLKNVEPLASSIFTTGIYDRFSQNNGKLDNEALALLHKVHASFSGQPISVRPSEKDENNPLVPTSGQNISFMLPNNHPEPGKRFGQFLKAIEHAFRHFTGESQPERRDADESVAVVVNPIHGVINSTDAGEFFYPMSSGVADSMLYYPLAGMGLDEGFARVVFGHGYGAVREDSEVDAIPVLSIEKPLDTRTLRKQQRFFYAIDMKSNEMLEGRDMETMSILSIRFAGPGAAYFSSNSLKGIDFGPLIGSDGFGYASGLRAIMEAVRAEERCFQIEFTFNIMDGNGMYHLVQYKRLPDLLSMKVDIPNDGKLEYVSTNRVQGHGVKGGLTHAVVISPWNYCREMHDEVRARLKQINDEMFRKGQKYVLVCPGRIGTSNKDWGIDVDFAHVSQAAVMVEYGFDIAGSPDIVLSRDEMTGGMHGSHFLYQTSGAAQEDEKIRELRRLGSQGTHFCTNLRTAGVFYLHIDPMNSGFNPWFFAPPDDMPNAPIYLKKFENPVTAYADLLARRCVIK